MRSARPKTALARAPATKPIWTALVSAAWRSGERAPAAMRSGRAAAAENQTDRAATWARAMKASALVLPAKAVSPLISAGRA